MSLVRHCSSAYRDHLIAIIILCCGDTMVADIGKQFGEYYIKLTYRSTIYPTRNFYFEYYTWFDIEKPELDLRWQSFLKK